MPNFIASVDDARWSPLPPAVRIQHSQWGSGIFADGHIKPGELIGLARINFEKSFRVRTPLGGYINHSDNSNCEIVNVGIVPELWAKGDRSYVNDGDCFSFTSMEVLVAKEVILRGEELSLTYTLYDLESEEDSLRGLVAEMTEHKILNEALREVKESR